MANTKQRFPDVKTSFHAMKGGLDLVTPAITKNPGSCFGAHNYEPAVGGGYRRINGFERSDGRTAPTGAAYWLLLATITGALAVGNTVTGVTSAATGKVLAISGATLVLGRVSGAFVSGEVLNVGGTPRATTTSVSSVSGATSASDHADYTLLAANDRRADIQAVPGSGQIRGIFVFNDIVHAFRDNAGATAGDLYKQSATGWVQVAFGREIQFTGATAEILAGVTITGATSGATATVVRAMLRTGTWTVSGVGTLILSGVTGVFQAAENLQVAAVIKAVAGGADTAITRLAGGRVEAELANFSGSAATKRIYGADGVNLGFEFDGTNYIPIRTGMTTDAPSHVAGHKNCLWFTFGASLQKSGVNQPYSWTVITGAAEFAMGDIITGVKSLKGNNAGASLLVSVASSYSILYGSSITDFNLVPSGSDLGFESWSLQSVGNDVFGLTSRGIQSLVATQNYGSFDFAAISTLVQPLLATKVGLQTASVSLKTKNQYRIFFSDNTALVVGLAGGKTSWVNGMPVSSGNTSGIMLLDYGLPVRCLCNANLSTGIEVTYFGSDNGYVYKDSVGTSFDGGVIEAWIRPAFNNLQSPQLRKTYKWAIFETESDGYGRVNVSYDLGYGNPDVEAAVVQVDQPIVGEGVYWDQFDWDSFTWDAQVVSNMQLSIDGTENNIAFLFYSSRAQDDPHTVTGVNLQYVPRRLSRGGS
jgi:hypothetical protein